MAEEMALTAKIAEALRERVQRVLDEHGGQDAEDETQREWRYAVPRSLCASLLEPEAKIVPPESDIRDDAGHSAVEGAKANVAAESAGKSDLHNILDVGQLGCWARKPAVEVLAGRLEAWNVQDVAPARAKFAMTVPGVSEIVPELADQPEKTVATLEAWRRLKAHCGELASDDDEDPFAVDRLVDAVFEALGTHGVLQVIGHRVTVGTVPSLCPPVGRLLATFEQPNRPGKPLTVGARALTKHCNRGAAEWWGGAKGNDAAKNARARARLAHIISTAVWVNVHVLPAGDKQTMLRVVELRCPEGFGARWTADGSLFRGFLEPVAAFQRDRVP